MHTKTLKFCGLCLLFAGIIIFAGSVIWSLKISFCFMKSTVGTGWTIAGLLLAPALIILLPWYLLFAVGEPSLIIISYGGWITAYIMVSIGTAVYNSVSDKKT